MNEFSELEKVWCCRETYTKFHSRVRASDATSEKGLGIGLHSCCGRGSDLKDGYDAPCSQWPQGQAPDLLGHTCNHRPWKMLDDHQNEVA
jgi:hypothetical protein